MKLKILILHILSFSFCLKTLDEQQLINHVIDSIAKANKGISKLSKEVLSLPGFSSSKNRHLLNNLCCLENSRYLEIGVWYGSTFISALYKNDKELIESFAVDDWSEFGGPKKSFINFTSKYLKSNNFTFYESDCFKLNLSLFKHPINIYFYDGNHTAESQKMAFTYFNSILSDTYIAIVDDYNEPQVQTGTQEAFKGLKYKVLFEEYLPSRFNGDLENWWNGLYVAVIKKK